MILSYSQMKEFVDCPRCWWYSHHEGIKPITYSKALQLGSLVHNACEQYGMDWLEIGKPCTIEQAVDVAWSNISTDIETCMLNPEQLHEIDETKCKARIMLSKYIATLPVTTYTKKEIPMITRIGQGVFYQAIADMIYVEGDDIVIREIKTKSNPNQAYFESLQISEQTDNMLNLFNFDRVEYAVIKSPQIKLKQKETIEEYHARLEEDITCTIVKIDKKEIDPSNKKKIMNVACRIASVNDVNDCYKNSQRCVTITSTCPYLPMCSQREGYELLYEKEKR